MDKLAKQTLKQSWPVLLAVVVLNLIIFGAVVAMAAFALKWVLS